jgi:hypothetical protein
MQNSGESEVVNNFIQKYEGLLGMSKSWLDGAYQ